MPRVGRDAEVDVGHEGGGGEGDKEEGEDAGEESWEVLVGENKGSSVGLL